MAYKLIDAASDLGCSNYVCGCNYVEKLSYYENYSKAIEFFSKLIEYGKTKGVKISTYNCRKGTFVHNPEAWKIIHVHLKGSLIINGERIDDPPVGLEQTDWKTFLSILYSKNYDGGLSVEPHSSTWQGELGQRGIKYTIGYMNSIMFK